MRNGSKWLGILAGAIALATATPALAQDQEQDPAQDEAQVHERHHGDRGAHDPEMRIGRLQEALDLTDQQAEQVRAIYAEQTERMRELRENKDREGLHALHRELHGRLAAVLDDAQREKLESLKRHGGEGHRDHDRAPHGEGHEEKS